MSYLRGYNFGSILIAAWRIYFGDALTILAIYIVPLAVAHILNGWLVTLGGFGILLGGFIVIVTSMFVSFPSTVAISEICLGIKPSVFRSYRRAFARPMNLIGSYLLAFGIMLLGFIALYVPGLVLSVWYAFIGPAVVLEARSGWDALRRSRELGRGSYLRIFGVVLVASIIMFVLAAVLGGIVGIVAALLHLDMQWVRYLAPLLGLLVAPPTGIVVVLLYYDMRVRKEGYAAAQLTEDLRF